MPMNSFWISIRKESRQSFYSLNSKMVPNSNIYCSRASSARMACSVPEFIELQRNSFCKLLLNGIAEEFAKITPLCLENDNSLKIIFYGEKYQLLLPENSAQECIFDLKSYTSKLYILAKLISKKSKQEVLQWVLVGNLPLMTRRGHFIINGSPRIIVHQVVRSPGVYFQQRRGSEDPRSSKQPRFYADFIPRRGVWLRLETTKSREFRAQLKNGKKIEAPLLQECFQFMESRQKEENTSNEHIWRSQIFNMAFEHLFPDSSLVFKNANEKAYNYLYKRFQNPKSYDLGKIGRQHINRRLKLSLVSDQLTSDDIDATLKQLVSLEKGDEILDDIDHLKNRRVRTSGELLQNQLEIGVYRLERLILTKLYTKIKELERDRLREKSNLSDQRFYRNNVFDFTDRRSVSPATLGRQRNLSVSSKSLKTNLGSVEDFEDPIEQITKNTRSTFNRTKESMPFSLVDINANRFAQLAQNRDIADTHFPLKSKTSTILKKVINSKSLNSAFREFFGTNPLSHYMDQTNPLAEITHKRRLCSLGLGGVSQDTAGMAVRGIHPSYYGRVCPIETPEGKNAGLMNSLGVYTRINSIGFLETPCYQVFKGQVQQGKGLFYLSAERESEEHFNLAPGDLQLSRTHLLEKMSVPVRAADSFIDEFRKVCSDDVDYIALSPIQMISIATSLIPFLEHDDANRALMGSNMQRQAVPLMIPERPLIGTGLESLVVAESGHVLQTETSGFISYVSSERIFVENLLDNKKHLSKGHNNHKWKPFRWLGQSQQSIGLIDYRSSTLFCCHTSIKQSPLRSGSPYFFFTPKRNTFSQIDSLSKGITNLRSLKICKVRDMKFFYESLDNRRPSVDRLCPKESPLAPIQFVENVNLHQHGLDLVLSSTKTDRDHFLQSYERSNQDTCLTQRTLVREGEWVQQGDILADCSASSFGELALGKNILVAYLPWEGYNFEDAIVLNQRLIHEDVYTSIHIERYEIETRGTKYGKERITSFVPGASWRQKRHLTRMGIPKIGAWLSAGDILVGKQTPLEPQPLTPYLRLFYDILERGAPREKDTSLRLPKGVQGRVIKHKTVEDIGLTHMPLGEEKRKNEPLIRSKVFQGIENNATALSLEDLEYNQWVSKMLISTTNLVKHSVLGKTSEVRCGLSKSSEKRGQLYKAFPKLWLANGNHFTDSVETASRNRRIIAAPLKSSVSRKFMSVKIDTALATKVGRQRVNNRRLLKSRLLHNGADGSSSDEQRRSEPQYTFGRNHTVKESVLKNVHVYVAEKRKIQIGDKMSGRHGNKGIVSLIMPRQDMPYLPDGTPLDILLNPLGVPSRMNVGQVFECLLGLSASKLGQQLKMTPFDEIYGVEASKSLVYLKLYQARLKSGQDWLFQLDFPGKTRLFDGRSGESFDQWVTVGRAYMLKLIHLVVEKIHARATGPYALITQQPLGGRSKNGGQRLGEMEVWALEGFGAAYTLQELLTKKSDDEQGRQQVIETILKREPPSSFKEEPSGETSSEKKARLKRLGSPDIFKVLVKELQSLCLGIGIYSLLSHPLKREQIDIV